jgi:mannose/fructose/N-acetylgalactosamine-specific phosphotransferase system component IIC
MDILTIGLLYALLSMDQMAVGPFMVSRPLVVGPLLGWAMGNPAMGLLVGVSVELLWIGTGSVGIFSVDTTLIAALAVYWSLSMPESGRPGVVAALALAFPFGFIIRRVDLWVRHLGDRLTPWILQKVERGQWILVQAMVLFLLVWFLKGLGFFFAFGSLGRVLLSVLLSYCPPQVLEAFDLAGRALPLVGFGAALNYFTHRSKIRWSWILSHR